jgi:hypothetical protein
MAETGEKPTDRIVVDVYKDSFQLSHTAGLDIMEVATLLYLCLQEIDKTLDTCEDTPIVLQ